MPIYDANRNRLINLRGTGGNLLARGWYTGDGSYDLVYQRSQHIAIVRQGTPTDSPFYRVEVGESALGLTSLSYTGSNIGGGLDTRDQISCAVAVSHDTFYLIRNRGSIYRCVLSGDEIRVAEITGNGVGDFRAGFFIDDTIICVGQGGAVREIAVSGTYTAASTGDSLGAFYEIGGGFTLGGNHYVVYYRSFADRALSIARLDGDPGSIARVDLSGPAPDIALTAEGVEATFSNGANAFAWNASDPTTVYKITINGNNWTAENFGSLSVLNFRASVTL